MIINRVVQILFLFLFWIQILPQGWAEVPGISQPIVGEFANVSGNVFVRSNLQDASAGKPIREGDQVHPGDVIQTAKNGKAKILMKDQSILDIGPSGVMKIDQYLLSRDDTDPEKKEVVKEEGSERQVQLNLFYGTLRTAVTQKLKGKGSFRVRTPSAIMGVRGTEFIVKSELGSNSLGQGGGSQLPRTEVIVLQGSVEVFSQLARSSAAGNGSWGRTPSSSTQSASKQGGQPNAQTAPNSLGSSGSSQGSNSTSSPFSSSFSGSSGSSPPAPLILTAGTQLVMTEGQSAPQIATMTSSQLSRAAEGAQLPDNTFQKAIGGEGPATGDATRSALTSAINLPALPPPPPVSSISPSTLGSPGTIGVVGSLNPPPVNTQPNLTQTFKVHVVLIR
jgi:hypothetical protein